MRFICNEETESSILSSSTRINDETMSAESLPQPKSSPEPDEPEIVYDEDGHAVKMTSDLIARMAQADRAVQTANDPGLSTINPLQQQELLDFLSNPAVIPDERRDAVAALLAQTQREFHEGKLDINGLDPRIYLPVDGGID